MKESWLKRLAVIVISLLLISYVGYQVYKATYTGVDTETAVYFTVSDKTDAEGFAVREEQTITVPQKPNAIKYTYEDGVKVAKGTTVARFYEKMTDVSAQERSDVLAEEIAQFERISSIKKNSDIKPEDLDGSISEQVLNILDATNQNQLKHFDTLRNQLLSLICERQIVTGAVADFNSRIEQLKQEKTQLEQSFGQAVGSVSAPVSGYFISSVDGYENAIAYTDVLGVTTDQLDTLLNTVPQVEEGTVGKISVSHEWYVICKVSANHALKLSKDMKLSLVIPSASSADIPAVVAAINQKDKKSDAAVVFRCTQLDASLTDLRKAPVQIKFEEFTGLRISKSALHIEKVMVDVKDENGKVTGKEEKDVQGVYILYGEELRFREICPLYVDNNYIICDANPTTSLTSNVLKLYDEVVVGGKDLYDGKYIK